MGTYIRSLGRCQARPHKLDDIRGDICGSAHAKDSGVTVKPLGNFLPDRSLQRRSFRYKNRVSPIQISAGRVLEIGYRRIKDTEVKIGP